MLILSPDRDPAVHAIRHRQQRGACAVTLGRPAWFVPVQADHPSTPVVALLGACEPTDDHHARPVDSDPEGHEHRFRDRQGLQGPEVVGTPGSSTFALLLSSGPAAAHGVERALVAGEVEEEGMLERGFERARLPGATVWRDPERPRHPGRGEARADGGHTRQEAALGPARDGYDVPRCPVRRVQRQGLR